MQTSYSQAAENNKQPILRILLSAFSPTRRVFEIGSGTGQHAEYFAQYLPQLHWLPSDLPENIDDLNERITQCSLTNISPAQIFDIDNSQWPENIDAVFSANTAHIMSWSQAQKMLSEVGTHLNGSGVFALYGPFNYQGEFTSESNKNFDQWLKSRSASQGIRDFEKVCACATKAGLTLVRDHAMPANNRLLIWKKVSNKNID